MSVVDNKFIQIDGVASGSKQPVKQSVFNDELRSWEEHKQTDPQAITSGVTLELTCDGGERNVTSPSGAVAVWNVATSEGTFIADGSYVVSITVTATASANNTVFVLRIVNAIDPLDFQEEVLELPRSGISDTVSATFGFISTGSSFVLEADADGNTVVDSVRIFAKREY